MSRADVRLHIGPVTIEISRWVYGIVILMTVLVVYADNGPVTYGESVGVVVGTMVATFLAHLFATVLAALNAESGRLTPQLFGELVRTDAQFLLLTVPPLIVLLVGALGAYPPPRAVAFIVYGGVGLLGAVGGLAGWRADLRLGGVIACAAASGALGFVVLVIQLVLKT
jgi:hypothetical protein